MVDLAELDVEDASFDKVFAVNVNVFWIPPHAPSSPSSAVLAPGGRLFLVCETPGRERARHAVERLNAILEAQGYAEPEVTSPSPAWISWVAPPRHDGA